MEVLFHLPLSSDLLPVLHHQDFQVNQLLTIHTRVVVDDTLNFQINFHLSILLNILPDIIPPCFPSMKNVPETF